MRAIPRVGRLATLTALTAAAVGAVGGAFSVGLLVGGHSSPARPSVLDQAAAVIKGKANTPASASSLDATAIRGMLDGLGDRWASYHAASPDLTSADGLQALLTGRYSGLGVWLRAQDPTHTQAVVASVTAGSPAAEAGVQAGDEIVRIDGTDMSGADSDTVAAALRGPAGSTVTLVLASAQGGQRVVTARRVDLSTVPVTVDMIAPGIERIRIATFSHGVGAEVAAAVSSAHAAHVRGFVLDLRGNPGGLLDEAVSTASVFLDGGAVVSLRGRSVPAQTLYATGHGDTSTPLAILVDGGTASAAEVLTGALSDRDRAVVVGSKTFGKGSVQQLTRLKDGSELELTVAEYRTPNGHVVDGVGLTPDVQVDPQAAPEVASDRAITLLDGLISSNAGSGA
jgi:carboxyl-terminal processing protease